jgi:hypothetical protein
MLVNPKAYLIRAPRGLGHDQHSVFTQGTI